MELVHREFKDRGLVVLAVNIQEPRTAVAAWAAKSQITMPILLDGNGAAARAYRVTATPTVFLVGRDGRLVAKAHGTKPWLSPRGRALLQGLVTP